MDRIETLRELAKKATPGPWDVRRHGKRLTVDAGSLTVATAAPQLDQPATAAYIAAASPDYVLKLLEVVDKARAYLEADGHANWMQSAALSAAIAALKE